MSLFLLGVVVALLGVVLVAIVVALRHAGRNYDVVERARMPAPLRDAVLVFSEEKRYGALYGRSLVTRFDQVFARRDDASLVVTETKTRALARLYPADVVELSVQAAVLREQPEAKDAGVSTTGYVRIVNRHGVRWLAIKLLTDAQLLELLERYEALEAGAHAPRSAVHPGLCKSCGQFPRCPHQTAALGEAVTP